MDMKSLRERSGLRTVDIASRLGKAESTIRNWDMCRKIPRIDIDEIPALLEAYECTLEELVDAARITREILESSEHAKSA